MKVTCAHCGKQVPVVIRKGIERLGRHHKPGLGRDSMFCINGGRRLDAPPLDTFKETYCLQPL